MTELIVYILYDYTLHLVVMSNVRMLWMQKSVYVHDQKNISEHSLGNVKTHVLAKESLKICS